MRYPHCNVIFFFSHLLLEQKVEPKFKSKRCYPPALKKGRKSRKVVPKIPNDGHLRKELS
jgi:hypothetical protein